MNRLQAASFILLIFCTILTIIISCEPYEKGCLIETGAFISIEKDFGFLPKIPVFFKPNRYKGLLLKLKQDSEILSYENGTVTKIERNEKGKYGNYVVVNGRKGGAIKYYHLSEIYLEMGETIRKGQEIGLSGNSGLVVSNGLGIEVYFNGELIAPLEYIEGCNVFK